MSHVKFPRCATTRHGQPHMHGLFTPCTFSPWFWATCYHTEIQRSFIREREHKPIVRRWLESPFFHSFVGQSIKLCFIVMTGKRSLLLAESISLCSALQSFLHNHKDEILPRSNRFCRHGKALWDAATLLRIWHSRQRVNTVKTCLSKTPDKPENHVNTIQKCKQDRRGYWTIIYVFTESC